MALRRKRRNLVIVFKKIMIFVSFLLCSHPALSYCPVCTYAIVVVTLRSLGLINKSNTFSGEENTLRLSVLFRKYSVCMFENSIFKTSLLHFIVKCG